MVTSPASSSRVLHLLTNLQWEPAVCAIWWRRKRTPAGHCGCRPRADVTKALRALNRPGKPLSLPSYSLCCPHWEK